MIMVPFQENSYYPTNGNLQVLLSESKIPEEVDITVIVYFLKWKNTKLPPFETALDSGLRETTRLNDKYIRFKVRHCLCRKLNYHAKVSLT